MKTETKKRIWDEFLHQINNGAIGGKNFSLFFDNHESPYLKIFNGHHWTIPAYLLSQITGEGKKTIEAAKVRAAEKSKKIAAQLKAERENREKRLDEPGFVLLAGENTKVVHQGTWRECRDNLWQVLKCERNTDVGLGCWVIVKGEFEAESGTFDRDCYY